MFDDSRQTELFIEQALILSAFFILVRGVSTVWTVSSLIPEGDNIRLTTGWCEMYTRLVPRSAISYIHCGREIPYMAFLVALICFYAGTDTLKVIGALAVVYGISSVLRVKNEIILNNGMTIQSMSCGGKALTDWFQATSLNSPSRVNLAMGSSSANIMSSPMHAAPMQAAPMQYKTPEEGQYA